MLYYCCYTNSIITQGNKHKSQFEEKLDDLFNEANLIEFMLNIPLENISVITREGHARLANQITHHITSHQSRTK